MFTKQAFLDTIEHISSQCEDSDYWVTHQTFDYLTDIFEIDPLGLRRNNFSTFFYLKNKNIRLSTSHLFDINSIKIYDYDPIPMYFDILTKEERIIKDVIE